MSARETFSDSSLEAMLRRRSERIDPVGLREQMRVELEAAPSPRRSWLPGPAPHLPMPWPAGRGLVPILLTAALVLAAVAGASVGAQIVRDGLLPRLPFGPEGVVVPPTPSPTPSPVPTPMPPAVEVIHDLVYESADPLLPDGLVDVYTPAGSRSHPVAVMLHAQPGVYTKETTAPLAEQLAAAGWVVFVPGWGLAGPEAMSLPWSERLRAMHRQAACAVAFARARAAEHGGDPSTLVLFGEPGAGANAATVLAFNRPAPSDGCPAGDVLGPVPVVITAGGDWLLLDTQWSQVVAKDPAVLDEGLPWAGLAERRDVRVWTLFSDDGRGVVPAPVGEPPIDWRTAGDPLLLRESLKASGPGGGEIDWAQYQAVFHRALTARGYEAKLVPYTGQVFAEGWPVVLAAFEEAAGQ